MTDLDLLPAPEKRTGKQVVGAVVAVLLTAGLLLLALYLGAWAYVVRSTLIQEKRLATLLEKKPKAEAVAEALRREGMTEMVAPQSQVNIREVAARLGGTRKAEVLEKSGRFAITRVFSSDSVVYFIYFDRAETMVGFTFVGRPARGGA